MPTHTPFPVLLSDTVGQDVFRWSSFLFYSILRTDNQHLTTKWKLLQILCLSCFKEKAHQFAHLNKTSESAFTHTILTSYMYTQPTAVY